MPNCYLCRGQDAEFKPFDYGCKMRVLCGNCVPYTITDSATDLISNSRASVRKQLIEMVRKTNTDDMLSLLYKEKAPNHIGCVLGGDIESGSVPLIIDVSYKLSKNSMSDVSYRRNQRNDLLVEIYEIADGITNGSYDIDLICQALNMDINTARQICVFWSKKGYLKLVMSGSGMITQEGIEEAERILEGDVIPSDHTSLQTASKVTSDNVKTSIFISYRRDDTADVTGRINERLVTRFGHDAIFTDVERIPLGVDFRQHLDHAVSRCEVLLAVIGKDWLTERLSDEADFVRIEIETALQRDIPVIPLLVRGAIMPATKDLPESLHGMAFRNGIPIRPDPDFNNDVNRLIASLEKHHGPDSVKKPREDTLPILQGQIDVLKKKSDRPPFKEYKMSMHRNDDGSSSASNEEITKYITNRWLYENVFDSSVSEVKLNELVQYLIAEIPLTMRYGEQPQVVRESAKQAISYFGKEVLT